MYELLVCNIAIYTAYLIILWRPAIVLLFAVTPHFFQPGDSIHFVPSCSSSSAHSGDIGWAESSHHKNINNSSSNTITNGTARITLIMTVKINNHRAHFRAFSLG